MRIAPSKEDIFDFFSRQGYAENSMITKPTLMSLFKTQYKLMHHEEINSEIIQQIWNESEATSRGQIYIKSIVDIVQEALIILMDRIDELEGEDRQKGMINDMQIEIEKKRKEYKEFTEYLSDNKVRLNQINKELIKLQIKERDLIFDLNSFKKDYNIICNLFQRPITYYDDYTKYQTVYKKQETIQEKKSLFLLIFNLTCLVLIFQLLAAHGRFSFLPITVYLHSLFIVLIRFYHKSAAIYLMAHCLISVVFDIVYMVLDFSQSELLMPLRPDNQQLYETILDIMLIGTIVGRVILILLYISLKNISFYRNGAKVNYFYVLLGNHIPINEPQSS